MTKFFTDEEKAVDALIEKVGKKIVIAMPVALAKPNDYINALYRRAKKDPSLDLEIMSALVTEIPGTAPTASDLEKRFYKPLAERIWKDYPVLEYWDDMRKGALPSNVKVYDLYAKSGAILDLEHVQQNYLNFNYTLIPRDLMERGVNVLGSIFTKRLDSNGQAIISGGSNTDMAWDISRMLKDLEKQGKKVATIGQITSTLPFMHGDDCGNCGVFDFMLEKDFPLFAVPKPSVGTVDHMIGFYTSTLIKDGGTVQIGIGALADGIVNSMIMRHENPEEYKRFLQEIGGLNKSGKTIERWGGLEPFKEGLHVNSEMLVEPFLHLLKKKIIKREIFDNEGIQKLVNEKKIADNKVPNNIIEMLLDVQGISVLMTEKEFKSLQKFGILQEDLKFDNYNIVMKDGTKISTDLRDNANISAIQKSCLGKELNEGYLVGAAFFLGSKNFYDELHALDENMRKKIHMNSVLKINTLYGDEKLRRLQRTHARHVNTAMYATLLGGIASDQLEDGRMVSGVGGQYNFVEMAHALSDQGGRSIITLKSTHGTGKKVASNIKFKYGHITIPRHLKDILITEYGIADLRGKTDAECIAEILKVSDSRFQEKLLAEAKAAKKIDKDYQIPAEYKNNFPEVLEQKMNAFREKGFFKIFPFGSDLAPEEIVLGGAMKKLKAFAQDNMPKMIPVILKKVPPEKFEKALPFLKRMGLDNPNPTDHEEKKSQKLMVFALSLVGKV